jgi:tripartite-type tricarboxylate transporter receptor subunit TctC
MQERLNAELNKILAMPDIAKRIESIGGEVKAAPAAALAKWIDTNTASYAAVIKDAGIKVQ